MKFWLISLNAHDVPTNGEVERTQTLTNMHLETDILTRFSTAQQNNDSQLTILEVGMTSFDSLKFHLHRGTHFQLSPVQSLRSCVRLLQPSDIFKS